VPRIREARWLANAGARAGIDISDGLAADAKHLARASGVSLAIHGAKVPCVDGVGVREALSSAEEYELLVAIGSEEAARIDVAAFEHEFGIALTVIGSVGAGEGVTIDGHQAAADGHDHFA
jgi:thiamine-monophosphate kinase